MTSQSPLLGSLVLGTLTAAFGCVGHTERRAGGAVPPATAAAAANTGVAAARACGPTALPPARVWRLTHAQLRNTLLDVFGHVGPAMDVLPADARLDGFANGASRLGVPPVLLEYYRKVADEVATEVIRHGSAPAGPRWCATRSRSWASAPGAARCRPARSPAWSASTPSLAPTAARSWDGSR